MEWVLVVDGEWTVLVDTDFLLSLSSLGAPLSAYLLGDTCLTALSSFLLSVTSHVFL